MGALPELVYPNAPYGLRLVSPKACCYVQAEAVAAPLGRCRLGNSASPKFDGPQQLRVHGDGPQ
jgi:hypothetical protein